jgi:general stress protein 26
MVLGSKKSELVKSISSNPQVNLGYSNTSNNDYVSINGVAENVIDEGLCCINKFHPHTC